MKKRRVLKKWYTRAIENLKLEQRKYVDARKKTNSMLAHVQTMHERAVCSLTEERDQLRRLLWKNHDLNRLKTRIITKNFTVDRGMRFLSEDFPLLKCVLEPNDHFCRDNPYCKNYTLRMYVETQSGKITDAQRDYLVHAFKEMFTLLHTPEKRRPL